MSEITDALTRAVGDAGVYAVFALMLVDAVLPAGSEIVMLYAGALAAGAFPDSEVSLFGAGIDSTAWGYVGHGRSPARSATGSARRSAGVSARTGGARCSSGTAAGST